MKTINTIIAILSISMLMISCNSAQKLVLNSDGSIENLESTFVPKGKNFDVIVKGPDAENVKITISGVEETPNQKKPTNILESLGQESSDNKSTVESDPESLESIEGVDPEDMVAMDETNSAQIAINRLTVKYENCVIECITEIDLLDASDPDAVLDLRTTISGERQRFWDMEAGIKNEFGDLSRYDYSQLKKAKKHFAEVKNILDNGLLVGTYSVVPNTDLVKIEIEVKDADDTYTSKSPVYLTTLGRFKITGSTGLHVLMNDGRYPNSFSVKDSILVAGRNSNLQPSIGTYINGTWRVNDAALGFGFGVGLPVNGDANPNFSAFGTAQFVTDIGRFGFNIGLGMRQIEVLGAGYSVGEKLGGNDLEIPMDKAWKPALMFGVNYIFTQDKE